MLRLVLGAAVGYFLGNKAGRERYNQIVGLGTRVKEDPSVQAAAGFAKARLTAVMPGRKASAQSGIADPAQDVQHAIPPLS